jgi:hypothetical protein
MDTIDKIHVLTERERAKLNKSLAPHGAMFQISRGVANGLLVGIAPYPLGIGNKTLNICPAANASKGNVHPRRSSNRKAIEPVE